MEIDGIDYSEVFSPVVSWVGIRIYLALTVLLGLIPLQLDIDLAYLYADLEEEVYMQPPSWCRYYTWKSMASTKISLRSQASRTQLE